jgi:hypothetical protein
MRYLVAHCWILLVLATPPLLAQPLPTIETKTAGFERRDGFFPLYWEEAAGQVWLEIPRWQEDFLYAVSLPAGLGSNDVGLDRGQLGNQQVVYFERIGPKVLLRARNLGFQATSDNPAERKAVEDAFAQGVVWGFTAAAQTDERVLVNATDFLVRDAHGIIRTLQATGQGSFRLEASRSAPYLERTKAFPRNTEMEATLTFTTDNPGGFVRDVAADPYAVTLRQRQSFIALPPPSFRPRILDPSAGYFGLRYVDYATPIGEEKEQRLIQRHRLECGGPRGSDGRCDPVAPIVYYLDPGTPEPVRSALLDGARWWNAAFEAAGFRNAFQVALLPEGADPMDVRYHVIQWVHRATRGWSYGSTVVDPRTGEIIKGHVTLGSLRVRQDYLLAEGLLAPYDDAHPNGYPSDEDPMLAMALARLRQLSAHEVGHTLGLAHNFAASVSQRASVMDYPAPLATLRPDGTVSLESAYATGIGAWDELAVRYGYTPFPDASSEAAGLKAILDEAPVRRLHYLTDQDARPPGAAHPLANLWDNGTDMIEALDQEMQVRQMALQRFGLHALREGRPLATLEEVLVPLYLRHRYQVEATVKLLGGVEYSYAVRGDARALPQAIPAAAQHAALDALLNTLTPEALRIPASIRTLLPPRPPEYDPHRELFDGYTGLTFDPYAPAETAAALVLTLLVHPERAARLAYQADFDATLPDLAPVLTRISEHVWEQRISTDPYDAELQRIVQQVWTDVLLDGAARPKLAPAVRARFTQHLREVRQWLSDNPGNSKDRETIAHRSEAFDQIDRFLLRFYRAEEQTTAPATPPGQPIGQAEDFQTRQQRRHEWLERWATPEDACAVSAYPTP